MRIMSCNIFINSFHNTYDFCFSHPHLFVHLTSLCLQVLATILLDKGTEHISIFY